MRARWGLDNFQLGVALGGASRPEEWQRDLDWVERADRAGLHSVWVPEMHFARRGTSSPLVTLNAFAAKSKKLRLATTSLLLPVHDPLVIADEVAALDRASNGRSLIGLGRGFRAPLFRAFGIDPQTKRDRFDAALDRMIDAWSSGHPAVRQPLQRPHPPLAVAAFGPKGLAQASRRGLPDLPSPLESPALLEENLRRHRAELPPDVDPEQVVVPVMRSLVVVSQPSQAKRVLAALGAEAKAMTSRAPKRLLDAASVPVNERVIVAPVQEATDRVAALRERLGIDLLIASPQVPGLEASERSDAFDRLCEEVWPALRGL